MIYFGEIEIYMAEAQMDASAIIKPGLKELSVSKEVTVRHFNPENSLDVARLHELDVATQDTLVTVTPEAPISEEHLKEWMNDKMLYATEHKGEAFGFVWFTDDANVYDQPEVSALIQSLSPVEQTVYEMSHGELPQTPPDRARDGLVRAVSALKESALEGKGIVTAYTFSEEEGMILAQAGFSRRGKVSKYIAIMDNGEIHVEEKEHTLYALDLSTYPTVTAS